MNQKQIDAWWTRQLSALLARTKTLCRERRIASQHENLVVIYWLRNRIEHYCDLLERVWDWMDETDTPDVCDDEWSGCVFCSDPDCHNECLEEQ